MTPINPDRVLGRRGARDVSAEEIQKVAGRALVPTRLTDFLTGTSAHPDHFFDE